MISFDTNIAVHAANQQSEHSVRAREFIESLVMNQDVAICEMMLVELYLKLRNERIFPKPLTAAQAAGVCLTYRSNQAWRLIDCAPVLDQVWEQAGPTTS